jgi:serine/threonine-protein kinase 11
MVAPVSMSVQFLIIKMLFSPSPRFITDHILEDEPHAKRTKQINQYVLLDVIGYGSTSKVFVALDTLAEQRLAVKAIPVNGSHHDGLSLEREVRLLRQLDHPNIVKFRSVLHSKKRHMAYIILEWASFGSLHSHLASSPSLAAIASIFKQIANGLDYLHGHGIIHHDIKPSNILLFDDGSAKLSDFGVGHSFDSASTIIGTPAYQAPEAFDDEEEIALDPVKEDVWSLGISLYEAAFGELPYEGEDMYQVSWAVRNTPLEIPRSAPGDLRHLLLKMLELDPGKRFDLDEVRSHPFISQASETFTWDISPRTLPRLSSSRSVIRISAEVCDDGYLFSCPRRSFSWPNIESPEAAVDLF